MIKMEMLHIAIIYKLTIIKFYIAAILSIDIYDCLHLSCTLWYLEAHMYGTGQLNQVN